MERKLIQILLSGLLGLGVVLGVYAFEQSHSHAYSPKAQTTLAAATLREGGEFEVWSLDQADTTPEGGGLLYIWDGTGLVKGEASAHEPTVINLAEAAQTANCPVAKRPHMSLLNNRNGYPSHAVLANYASGDIEFLDVETREIVGCVNLVEAGGVGTGLTHAAFPTPDNSMVVVADLGGNALHKISTDYDTNAFELVETLDLRSFAAELGTETVAPVCHNYTADSKFAYITLQQGGVLVVDLGAADGSVPMSVAHVYPAAMVPGEGCGAFPVDDQALMLTNGENRTIGGTDYFYIFDTSGLPNQFPEPTQLELPGDDTHGSFVCTSEQGKAYAWTFMRLSNQVNIVDLAAKEIAATLPFSRSFSPAPTPDLASIADGKAFVALRGAKPVTAINSFQSADRTPGVAMLTVSNDCLSFDWQESDLLPMVNNPSVATLEDGTEVNAADPHGVEIVWRRSQN